ncbi:MAG TPA: hypothetical protein VM120_05030 [Bryobacteraceae bacterium]|nr:hypothetical protein [Bryobacteraceae bacterium]
MRRPGPSPKIRELAIQLLDYEAANPGDVNIPAVLCVSEKLRRPLSTLMGNTGFRSLMARSLTLAKAQVPGLDAVQVTPDGSLEGLSDPSNNDQHAQTGAMLIAQLLELLVTFIGEGLMLSLVLDAWPDFTAIRYLGEKRS